MDESLRQETELLRRSWERHECARLRDYLVAGVEDPRINLQSIFTRHFIIRTFAEKRTVVMEHECRFSAVMNWLLHTTHGSDPELLKSILHALEHGSDNAEGLQIPAFVLETFRSLPGQAGGLTVPNYVLEFLREAISQPGTPFHAQQSLDTFSLLWREALDLDVVPAAPRSSVLEAACGSANDYRALAATGIADRIAYTGFDLSPKNIANAQSMFPRACFRVGNVFEIDGPDLGFDLVFAHDLFEHLSPAGVGMAIRELCRVSRFGVAAGFFSMDEIPDHIVRPLDDYHWNTLSMGKIREAFARESFACRVIHVASFLQERVGCEQTHNPTAYTFLCWREGTPLESAAVPVDATVL